jgi:hypothetical protein
MAVAVFPLSFDFLFVFSTFSFALLQATFFVTDTLF